MSKPRVAVIGAGISGMTAAYHLQKAGIDVRVFEEKTVPGGRVVTLRKDGYVMDLGAEVFTSSYTVYSKLVQELGLTNQTITLPSIIGTIRGGRVEVVDMRSSWSMLTTKTLSIPAKLRLVMAMKQLQPLLADVSSSFLHEQAPLDPETSSADAFSLRHFGRELTDYLIDPMVKLLGGSSAERSSAVSVIGDLKLSAGVAYSFASGQEVFTKALANRVSIQYQTKVTRLLEHSDGVELKYLNVNGEASREQFDAAILATMFDSAVEIYPYFKEITTELRENLSYIGTIKVFLGYKARTRCRAYAIQVPTLEDPEMMAMFLEHNKCDSRVPPGHSLLHCDTVVETTERMIGDSDASMESWARERAEHLFPELRGHHDFCHVARWPNMANFNSPGYFQRVARVLERLPADGRIQIASDIFTKTHQEAAAAWGQRAADNIMRHHA